MRNYKNTVAGFVLGSVIAGAVLAGCSNSSTSQGLPYKPTSSDIAAVQNNPNIPADKKASIIAAMEGKSAQQTQTPAGAVPAYVTNKPQ